MEKKIVEKMEMAIKLFEEKVEKFNYDAKIFCEETFTEDIREMLEVIADATRCNYSYSIEVDCKRCKIIVFSGVAAYSVEAYDSARHYFQYNLKEFSIDDRGLDHLEREAKKLDIYIKWLHIVQNNAKNIIEDITSKYKKLTEKQNDKVDSVLELLGAEYEPTKHIKVTVEWL